MKSLPEVLSILAFVESTLPILEMQDLERLRKSEALVRFAEELSEISQKINLRSSLL